MKTARKMNVEGNLYVDYTCINCDTCLWMCPSTFSKVGAKVGVISQPTTPAEKLLAYAAMVACPVGAINVYQPDPLMFEALDLFPMLIDPERLPNVYHCGYHSQTTFGGIPYFIKRDRGNVMIDNPRYTARYSKQLKVSFPKNTF